MGFVHFQQRHIVRQTAQTIERQLLEWRKSVRIAYRRLPSPTQSIDFKRSPRTPAFEPCPFSDPFIGQRAGIHWPLRINLRICPR